jgi:hypothetical protein
MKVLRVNIPHALAETQLTEILQKTVCATDVRQNLPTSKLMPVKKVLVFRRRASNKS